MKYDNSITVDAMYGMNLDLRHRKKRNLNERPGKYSQNYMVSNTSPKNPQDSNASHGKYSQNPHDFAENCHLKGCISFRV